MPKIQTRDWKKVREGLNASKRYDKKHSPATIAQTDRLWKIWETFHKDELQTDPMVALKGVNDATDITLFLLYIYSKRKGSTMHQSTITTNFKHVQLLYRKHTGDRLPQKINDDVNTYIQGDMTTECGLIIGQKEKPVVTAVCFVRILEGLWKLSEYRPSLLLVQCQFCYKLMAYTAARPGAIAESQCYTGEGLLFKDVTLRLVGDLFVIHVRFDRTKGKRDLNGGNQFTLYEMRDNPILCPVFDFLAIAFAENAFRDVKCPRQLYQLKVPETLDYLEIPYRSDILDVPVCRRPDGAPISSHTLANKFKGSAKAAGFEQEPTLYWLRRGAGNAINGVATTAERNQIMGHNSSAVFEKYYISHKIGTDTQSSFLGTNKQTDIFAQISRIKRDPAAPFRISKTDKLWDDSELQSLLRQRDMIKQELKGQYQCYRDNPTYIAADREVNCRKAQIRTKATEDMRKDYFENASSHEIRRQLAGNEPSQYVIPKRNYQSLQHELLIEAIFDSSSAEHTRPDIILHLVEFFQKPGTPDCNKNWHCPFCPRPHGKPPKVLSSHDNLKRHVKKTHLSNYDSGLCPYPKCGQLCSSVDFLKHHIASTHNLFL